MHFAICLEDEHRYVQEMTELVLTDVLLSDYKLLRYIDPYGDVVFNRLQMDDVLADLYKLKEEIPDIDVAAIIAVAIKCKQGIHLYLSFCGDRFL